MADITELRRYTFHDLTREVSVQRSPNTPHSAETLYTISVDGFTDDTELTKNEARALRDCLNAALDENYWSDLQQKTEAYSDLAQRVEKVLEILLDLKTGAKMGIGVWEAGQIEQCINIIKSHD